MRFLNFFSKARKCQAVKASGESITPVAENSVLAADTVQTSVPADTAANMPPEAASDSLDHQSPVSEPAEAVPAQPAPQVTAQESTSPKEQHPKAPINETIMQYFEWNLPTDQNHWNYIRENAQRVAELGITMAWLPPAYKGAGGIEDVGYGVYDLYDLGEFDQKGGVPTKYGTKEEYLNAVSTLQQHHIKVLTDVVLNQMLGADTVESVYAVPVDPADRLVETGEAREIGAYTGFSFPGRAGRYSNFSWHWNQFSGVDRDEKTDTNEIYRFTGKQWNEPVDTEFGNFDYLMGADLDMDDDCTRRELENWGKWFIDTVRPDGFRMDAVKHIKFTFTRDWVNAMRAYAKERYGQEDLFVVGEYWHGDVKKLREFLNDSDDAVTLFDVPLHYHFQDAANAGANYDLRGLMTDTLIAENKHAVTFVDNHDTQPGEALQSWVAEWFKPFAYSIILLQEYGTPCVFFGDYRGMPHDRTAPTAGLDELMVLRKTRAYGMEYPYFDDAHIAGFTRAGDALHEGSGLAVLFSNEYDGEKQMYIGEQFAGTEFADYLGNSDGTVLIDNEGKGVFRTKGGSVAVWVPEAGLTADERTGRQQRLDAARELEKQQALQAQQAQNQEQQNQEVQNPEQNQEQNHQEQSPNE